MKASSAILIFWIVAAGCASSGEFRGAAAEGGPGAIVKGTGSGLGVTFGGLGVAKNIRLHRVNGERVNSMGSADVVRLSPGMHRLTVACAFKIDGRLMQQHAEIGLEVLDGHTYQLDAAPPCKVSATDVTKSQ